MFLLALIAVGAVILLAARESEGNSLSPAAYTKALAEHAASTNPDSKPADVAAQDQAFIDLYKKHKAASDAQGAESEATPAPRVGRFAATRNDAELPPEYPRSDDDLGAGGDMNTLPDNLFNIVHSALMELHDPIGLFEVADAIEGAGYPLSANRLKRKALRLLEVEDVA